MTAHVCDKILKEEQKGHPRAWKNLTPVIKVQKMSASKYFVPREINPMAMFKNCSVKNLSTGLFLWRGISQLEFHFNIIIGHKIKKTKLKLTTESDTFHS